MEEDRNFDFRTIQQEYPKSWQQLQDMYSITVVEEDKFWSEVADGLIYKSDLFYFFDTMQIFVSISVVNCGTNKKSTWKYMITIPVEVTAYSEWGDAGFTSRDKTITIAFTNAFKKLEKRL